MAGTASRKLEFLRFQAREFQALAPRAGELEELESRIALLSSVEEWRERAGAAAELLGDGERWVLRVLAQQARILGDAPDQRLGEAGRACAQAADLVREAAASAPGPPTAWSAMRRSSSASASGATPGTT